MYVSLIKFKKYNLNSPKTKLLIKLLNTMIINKNIKNIWQIYYLKNKTLYLNV